MDRHFIYLLQTGSSIRYNEGTYKIGRTTRKFGARASEYEKGTEVIFSMMVDDDVAVEAKIIKTFDKLFVKRVDLGLEYYSGDVTMMLENIMLIIQKRIKTKAALSQKFVVESNLKLLQNQQLNSLVNGEIPTLLRNLELSSSTENSPKKIIININNDYGNKKAILNEYDDIQTFIDYIKLEHPSWYTEEEYIDISHLHRHFIKITKSKISCGMFSKKCKGILFGKSVVNTVEGKSVRQVVLWKINDL